MRIIISPAKKMNIDTDSLPYCDLPRFLEQAEYLQSCLRGMSYETLKSLWKCNDKIASLNYERLQKLDLRRNLTPALISYEGIQYQYMAPGVFTRKQFDYVQEHLRILSGFYGVLRPFDGVVPYRLEMQAKLKTCNANDLYSYWRNSLYSDLTSETDCILNLASKEYSLCVSRYVEPNIRFITCVFGELVSGRIIEKGTLCKMARGEMVRFMAENLITNPDDLRAFESLGYQFDTRLSTTDTYIFLKKEAKL